MRIGELARAAAVSTSLLRYYEEQGLLGPAARSETGYRQYGPDAIGRLAFIQRAKSLGLTLREIRSLVQEPGDAEADLARLRHIIAHKLADTKQRIAELTALQGELEGLYFRLGRCTTPCDEHIGNCDCWLPTGEEVKQMIADVRKAECCTCCDCPCRCDDGTCTCCDGNCC
ncbi:heavy metal-responsive transcriptional regulator [Nitrolancea hollandica]|uniref:Putative transcriptional regulatory protein (Probably merR-family) n=1 Tax=Nitrolancea hollandica Lb TaxID=1129897 RepID=I4EDS0_9BACT|nr:heavy metal-responsive transcriptional regulator [Nitrolancea hollandica]CCF82832.1 putative transcriptional regulatory protein (Probably merR-family) [Nitrolancea hollandica Lb]